MGLIVVVRKKKEEARFGLRYVHTCRSPKRNFRLVVTSSFGIVQLLLHCCCIAVAVALLWLLATASLKPKLDLKPYLGSISENLGLGGNLCCCY